MEFTESSEISHLFFSCFYMFYSCFGLILLCLEGIFASFRVSGGLGGSSAACGRLTTSSCGSISGAVSGSKGRTPLGGARAIGVFSSSDRCDAPSEAASTASASGATTARGLGATGGAFGATMCSELSESESTARRLLKAALSAAESPCGKAEAHQLLGPSHEKLLGLARHAQDARLLPWSGALTCHFIPRNLSHSH